MTNRGIQFAGIVAVGGFVAGLLVVASTSLRARSDVTAKLHAQKGCSLAT